MESFVDMRFRWQHLEFRHLQTDHLEWSRRKNATETDFFLQARISVYPGITRNQTVSALLVKSSDVDARATSEDWEFNQLVW